MVLQEHIKKNVIFAHKNQYRTSSIPAQVLAQYLASKSFCRVCRDGQLTCTGFTKLTCCSHKYYKENMLKPTLKSFCPLFQNAGSSPPRFQNTEASEPLFQKASFSATPRFQKLSSPRFQKASLLLRLLSSLNKLGWLTTC